MGDTLFIAGTYDEDGGRPSKIGRIIFDQMHLPEESLKNGGYLSALEELVHEATRWDRIYWLAKVPESRRDLSKRIKAVNEMAFLVGSMQSDMHKPSFAPRIEYGLERGADLMVEFSEDAGRFYGRIFDPLGNVFAEYTDDFKELGSALERTAKYLSSFTKVPAMQVGQSKVIPIDYAFLGVVQHYAKQFHELIEDALDIRTPMGNASFRFRCLNGFPSYKQNEFIYVTMRHIDKRYLNAGCFVPVRHTLPVEYYGPEKPSVDTAIQVRLYEMYPLANYVIHSHVNIDGAPTTDRLVPCGRIEEADEIWNVVSGRKRKNFAVNLKGHGSLIVMNDLHFMEGIRYYARKIPEFQEVRYE